MVLPRLIGIAGLAGAGKDTLADYLVRQHGFVKYSLASPIKRLLNERFGWTDKDWQNRAWKERAALSSLFYDCGLAYQGCAVYSPRELAQWLGTEVGRDIGGEDVWINLMEREWYRLQELCSLQLWTEERMVVPDVRFDNEARRIHALGGVVLQITRPGPAVAPAHASEKGVSPSLISYSIANDTDVITFLQRCMHYLERAEEAP